MSNESESKDKQICSLLEFRKRYFPNYFEEMDQETNEFELKSYGIKLATEILEKIERKLSE